MSKILIVEDDPMMSRMYQKAFQFAGYEITMASNGLEGLQKAKEIKPDLILLDVMMPKMNGLEFLDNKKSDPVISNIPVIMLTNLAGTQDAEKALEKGALKYIIKSEYEPSQVMSLVKEALAGKLKAKSATPAPIQTSPQQPTDSAQTQTDKDSSDQASE